VIRSWRGDIERRIGWPENPALSGCSPLDIARMGLVLDARKVLFTEGQLQRRQGRKHDPQGARRILHIPCRQGFRIFSSPGVTSCLTSRPVATGLLPRAAYCGLIPQSMTWGARDCCYPRSCERRNFRSIQSGEASAQPSGRAARRLRR